MPFDYNAPAELFLAKRTKNGRKNYQRLTTAAEAILRNSCRAMLQAPSMTGTKSLRVRGLVWRTVFLLQANDPPEAVGTQRTNK
jgi:hypothetical protein